MIDRKVTIYFGSLLLNRYLFLAFGASFVTLEVLQKYLHIICKPQVSHFGVRA